MNLVVVLMLWLHRFAKLLAAFTLLLVVAGGLVTSNGAGLSVPDWPNTFGQFMFSFPLSKMVGGILYEHGHRLIATTVGGLTIVLAAWLWWKEPRVWVKRLGLVALAAVIVQGVLGGLTVLLLLPAPISVAHAGLAQLFFCLTVSLALFTSPGWRLAPGAAQNASSSSPFAALAADRTLRRLTVITTAVVYVQILLGATMRHAWLDGARVTRLAIPDFPLAFGRLVPPLDLLATGQVAVHFAHRVVAVIVLCLILAIAWHVRHWHRSRGELARPAALLVALAVLQIALGGLTVLTGKDVVVNTAHVAIGSLVLVTSLVLALRTRRPLFDLRLVPVADETRMPVPGLQPARLGAQRSRAASTLARQVGGRA